MFVFLIGFFISALTAVFCSRLAYRKQKFILNFLAILLPLSELWKQAVLTCSNCGVYQWWYFPFQLCSMPLYLLPLRQFLVMHLDRQARLPDRGILPFIAAVLTDFLSDFGLLAGIFAFADQTGMHYALPALTVHSYLWHFVMIFLGILLGLSSRNRIPSAGFLPCAALFALLALAAELLNLLLCAKGPIDMFYISPLEPSTQVILRDAAARIGRGPEIILYLFLIASGAGILHLFLQKMRQFVS